jgi:ribosomal protein L12E/L44/L45/RPP1/RPP2
MKPRGLLAAVIVLVALGGALYWSNRKQKADAAKPATDTATTTTKILSIPEDQIKEVSIKKTGAEPTTLQMGADGKWQLTEPKPQHADQDTAKSLVSSLATLNADKVVEDKATDLSPYGLSAPTLDVTVTKKDGKSQDFLVGDDTPTGGGAYAKLAGDPHVYTIASYVKTSIDKTPNDLRDKRLLTFDQDKLTRVDLQPAKGDTIEFGKNNQNDWQILKPKPLRADGSQVEELIRKLKDAKMDATISDEDAKKAAAAYGPGTKVATASVTDASGTETLEVRKDKDKNYYAKSSTVDGIYKVTADLGDGLDKKVDDFRNKKLFDFGWTDPNKIDIGKAAFEKSGDKWMSGAKQMDAPSVQSVVDKLRDLTAGKFLDSGVGTPVLDVTVSSNNGKRVEKASITKQGDTYFAKRENEPSIYQLDSKAVEDLQKAANEVKPFQPPKK